GYQLPVEIFKYLTIQAVDCCLVCGEFVKRNWHGESPCAAVSYTQVPESGDLLFQPNCFQLLRVATLSIR
ncbi:hypothetical protein ACP80U_24905, partial [Escherichia coli]